MVITSLKDKEERRLRCGVAQAIRCRIQRSSKNKQKPSMSQKPRRQHIKHSILRMTAALFAVGLDELLDAAVRLITQALNAALLVEELGRQILAQYLSKAG